LYLTGDYRTSSALELYGLNVVIAASTVRYWTGRLVRNYHSKVKRRTYGLITAVALQLSTFILIDVLHAQKPNHDYCHFCFFIFIFILGKLGWIGSWRVPPRRLRSSFNFPAVGSRKPAPMTEALNCIGPTPPNKEAFSIEAWGDFNICLKPQLSRGLDGTLMQHHASVSISPWGYGTISVDIYPHPEYHGTYLVICYYLLRHWSLIVNSIDYLIFK